MKKGQLVKVKAIVESGYYGYTKYGWTLYSGNGNDKQYRCIHRKEERLTAIFLGYSHMNEGIRNSHPAEYYGEVGEFKTTKQHKVCVLEPFNAGDNRYYKPVRALPEDVEGLGLNVEELGL